MIEAVELAVIPPPLVVSPPIDKLFEPTLRFPATNDNVPKVEKLEPKVIPEVLFISIACSATVVSVPAFVNVLAEEPFRLKVAAEAGLNFNVAPDAMFIFPEMEFALPVSIIVKVPVLTFRSPLIVKPADPTTGDADAPIVKLPKVFPSIASAVELAEQLYM